MFGDLCRAAHEDGLAVFARMDSNRANEELYKAHPDWFALDAKGKPYKAGDLYITCISGPYYKEHIPSILKEIYELYHPEGFTDNSWSGLGRESICYCENCRKSFRAKTGKELLEIYKEQHADLILMDIKMPEMNGIDALKEIRKFDAEIPVIMQSAYAFENDMESARQAGSNGFITKPINIKELKATLSNFLPTLTW